MVFDLLGLNKHLANRFQGLSGLNHLGDEAAFQERLLVHEPRPELLEATADIGDDVLGVLLQVDFVVSDEVEAVSDPDDGQADPSLVNEQLQVLLEHTVLLSHERNRIRTKELLLQVKQVILVDLSNVQVTDKEVLVVSLRRDVALQGSDLLLLFVVEQSDLLLDLHDSLVLQVKQSLPFHFLLLASLLLQKLALSSLVPQVVLSSLPKELLLLLSDTLQSRLLGFTQGPSRVESIEDHLLEVSMSLQHQLDGPDVWRGTLVQLGHVLVHLVRILPVLGLDEEAEVADDGSHVSGLASSAVNVNSVLLAQQEIQLLGSGEDVVSICLGRIQVVHGMPHVLHAALSEPLLHLLLIDTPPSNLIVRLETEHGSDTTVLLHPLDVDLIERVRAKDDVPALVSLANFVKEEALQESTISLLDDPVHSLNSVNTAVMRSGGGDLTMELARIGLFQESGRLSLDDRGSAGRLLLDVGVEQASVGTRLELAGRVAEGVGDTHFALEDSRDRLAVLTGNPVLVLHVDSCHLNRTVRLLVGKDERQAFSFLAELYFHFVPSLVERVEYGEANLELFELVLDHHIA